MRHGLLAFDLFPKIKGPDGEQYDVANHSLRIKKIKNYSFPMSRK